MKKAIIEVGAFDGIDGLALAYKNPSINVYAFEANPLQIKIIKKNKKILEKRKGILLNNYLIYNYAISKQNKINNFYISKNPRASSLNLVKNNLEKFWPGWKKIHFEQIKKVKVKSIKLEKFCIKKKIDAILYLHIDAQGSDLEILKSLKKYINLVQDGVIEVAKTKASSLYKKNHTLNDVKKFFKKKFKIYKMNSNTVLNNELNVYFKKKSFNIESINKKYNARYFKRIFYNRSKLKDDLFDFIERSLNQLTN